MDIDYNEVCTMLKEFEKLQGDPCETALDERQEESREIPDVNVLDSVKKFGKRFFQKLIPNFMKSFMCGEQDEIQNWKILKGITDFQEACEIILTNLKRIYKWESTSEVHDTEILKRENLETTIYLFEQREVVFSFYGDCNAGKSTVLNAILGDWYLPTGKDTTTAVPVRIEFMESTLCDGDDNDDAILSHKEGGQIRQEIGQKNIFKKLSDINGDVRKHQSRVINPECKLKMKHSLGDYTKEGMKCVLLDNPGCDEFGSMEISRNVDSAKALGCAFIIITTLDGYRKDGFGGKLRSLYQQYKDLLKDDQLTIVVNKMDEALIENFGEECHTQEEIKLSVSKFVSDAVFMNEQELPPESVVLVSGKWALYARQYKKSPTTQLERAVKNQIQSMGQMGSLVTNEDLTAMMQEDPPGIQAEKLEEYSQINQLEERIKMMAENSVLIWMKKMEHDLFEHMAAVTKQLNIIKSFMEELIEGLEKDVKSFSEFIHILHDEYKSVVENYSACIHKKLSQENEVMDCFVRAYAVDEKKILFDIMDEIKKELTTFVESTETKMFNEVYTPEDLVKDIEVVLDEQCQKINKNMSNYMEKLANEYSKQNNISRDKLQKIGDKFSNLLEKYQKKTVNRKSVDFVVKKEEFSFFLTIPLPLTITQRFFWNLRHYTWMSTEMYVSPEMEATISLGSSTEKSDSSTTTKKSSTDIFKEKVETTYTRWSSDLDSMGMTILEETVKALHDFFKDHFEENIIQKCCEQHYEFALSCLKEFDQLHKEEIQFCLNTVTESVKKLKEQKKELEELNTYIKTIAAAVVDFSKISNHEFGDEV